MAFRPKALCCGCGLVVASIWACGDTNSDTNGSGVTAEQGDASHANANVDDAGNGLDARRADAASDAKAKGDAKSHPDASGDPDGNVQLDAAPPDASVSPCDSPCEIVTTVNQSARPTTIVVDATDVYFSYILSGYVWRAPKSGGSAPTQVAHEQGADVHDLAADAQNLYLVAFGASEYHIDRVAKTGGAFTLMYQSGFASNIDADNVIVDSSVLYLAAGSNAGGTVTLLSIDKTSKVATPVNNAWSPGHWLAASGANLYWSSGGKIWQATKSGSGSPLQMAWPGSNMNARIAVDGSDVFYVDRQDVEVHKVTGTTDTTLNATAAPSADGTIGPIADSNYAYVIALDSSDGGTIYRIPRGGGALEVFAADQPSPRALAQDANYIYWSATGLPGAPSGTLGHVLRKPK